MTFSSFNKFCFISLVDGLQERVILTSGIGNEIAWILWLFEAILGTLRLQLRHYWGSRSYHHTNPCIVFYNSRANTRNWSTVYPEWIHNALVMKRSLNVWSKLPISSKSKQTCFPPYFLENFRFMRRVLKKTWLGHKRSTKQMH